MAIGFLELSHFSNIYESVGLEKAGEFLRSIMTHIHDVIHGHQAIDKHMKEGLVFISQFTTKMVKKVSKALEDICNEFESIASLTELQGLHLNIGMSFGAASLSAHTSTRRSAYRGSCKSCGSTHGILPVSRSEQTRGGRFGTRSTIYSFT